MILTDSATCATLCYPGVLGLAMRLQRVPLIFSGLFRLFSEYRGLTVTGTVTVGRRQNNTRMMTLSMGGVDTGVLRARISCLSSYWKKPIHRLTEAKQIGRLLPANKGVVCGWCWHSDSGHAPNAPRQQTFTWPDDRTPKHSHGLSWNPRW